jgi:hypothetical protein
MSNVELNLLPDVKMEYIKTQRLRRLVITVALLVTVASVAILILLLGFDGLQKKHLSDLNRDIGRYTNKLQHEPNIKQILTVQNQLNSLNKLHTDEPNASQLFAYLNELTPTSCSINNFSVDFTQQSMTITGSADALSSVNQYVDTLKNATYTTGSSSGSNPAFKNVVLSSFGLNSTATNAQPANYTITLSYDQNIFDITQNVTLTVPSSTTTRSSGSSQSTTDLFQASPTQSTTNGGSH